MGYYSPYRRDVDDIEYHKTHRPSGIYGLILGIIDIFIVIIMICAAFIVSPIMGTTMVITMLLLILFSTKR